MLTNEIERGLRLEAEIAEKTKNVAKTNEDIKKIK